MIIGCACACGGQNWCKCGCHEKGHDLNREHFNDMNGKWENDALPNNNSNTENI